MLSTVQTLSQRVMSRRYLLIQVISDRFFGVWFLLLLLFWGESGECLGYLLLFSRGGVGERVPKQVHARARADTHTHSHVRKRARTFKQPPPHPRIKYIQSSKQITAKPKKSVNTFTAQNNTFKSHVWLYLF